MPVEIAGPAIGAAALIIAALIGALVRERRRNGNPGNRGAPVRCTLASAEWTNRFAELHADLGRIEAAQRDANGVLTQMNLTLVAIKTMEEGR